MKIPRGIPKSRVQALRASRRRVEDCDALPGLDPVEWDKQKKASEFRMRVIDQQPPEWKALLNDFDHRAVVTVADQTASPDEARRLLERRFGKAI